MVESKFDIYKKELANYDGYQPRKVYWKDLHYWGMEISRNAVTHVNGNQYVSNHILETNNWGDIKVGLCLLDPYLDYVHH